MNSKRLTAPLAYTAFITFFTIACGSQGGTGPRFDAEIAKVQSTANNEMALRMYEAVSEQSPDINICPLSMELILGSLYELSGEDQKSLIADLIDDAATSTPAATRFHHWTGLLQSNTSTNLYAANGFWLNEELPLSADVPTLKPYLTSLRHTSFAPSESLINEINVWIDSTTNANIENVLAPGSLDEDSKFIGASGTFFDGSWTQKFNASLTEEDTFYDESSNPLGNATFMSQTIEVPYLESGSLDATILSLQFGSDEGDYSLVIAIPNGTLAALEQSISQTTFEETLSELEKVEPTLLSLSLPKWQSVTTIDFRDLLVSMDLGSIFEETADYSSMTAEPVALTALFHKSIFRVAEGGTHDDGTEDTTQIDNGALDVKVNRPFLYFLVHGPTNSIIFMGRQKTVESFVVQKLGPNQQRGR
ncbi:MAG: serpin family protein [Oligoflexales bacterium]